MACRGLLFFLSSSLLLCSLSASPPPAKQEGRHLQKRGPKTEKFLTAADYTTKILKATSPYIGMIPVAGKIINVLVAIISLGLDKMKTDPTQAVLRELDSLNLKVDKYHVEQIWEIWSVHYSKYESNIKVAFDGYQSLVKDIIDKDKSKDDKDKHVEQFKSIYSSKALTTKKLHHDLTAQQPSFLTKFEKLVTDKFRCHEDDIKKMTVLITDLIFKGNTLDLFYDRVSGVDKIDELGKIAYESAKVMFNIYKHCISNFMAYVELDVKDRINEKTGREELAKEIRLFLDKTYNRYNWITVAFLTKHSSHEKSKSQNKHTLSDVFTLYNLPNGGVTVAVAAQVKGSHTKADLVRKAIEKCVPKSESCHKVEEKLSKCEELVDKIKASDTYTVIHAFISKSHDSVQALDAKEASEPEDLQLESLDTPYVYTGECKGAVKKGHYRVLIKSDEEMAGQSPCAGIDCGGEGKGKCELVAGTLIPVCECEEGHYGEKCEETVEGYKEGMREKMPDLK